MLSKINVASSLTEWIRWIPNERVTNNATPIERTYVNGLAAEIDRLTTSSGDYVVNQGGYSEIKRGWKGDFSSKKLAIRLWRGISYQHSVSGLVKGNRHAFDDIYFATKKDVLDENKTGAEVAKYKSIEKVMLDNYKEKLLESILPSIGEVLPIVLIKDAVEEYVVAMYAEYKGREQYRELVENKILSPIGKVQFLRDNIDNLSSGWNKVLSAKDVVLDKTIEGVAFSIFNSLLIVIPVAVGSLISPVLGVSILGSMAGYVLYKVGGVAIDAITIANGEGFGQRLANAKDAVGSLKLYMGEALRLTKEEPGSLWSLLTKDNELKVVNNSENKKSHSLMPIYERIVLNDAKRLELKKSKRLAEVANRAFGGGDTLSGVEEEIKRRIKESVVVDETTIASEKEFSEKIGGALSKLKAMNAKVDKGSKIT